MLERREKRVEVSVATRGVAVPCNHLWEWLRVRDSEEQQQSRVLGEQCSWSGDSGAIR